MYPTERLAKAKHDAVCVACRRLIKEGELRRGIAQPDGSWHSVHPTCLEAYEEQLAAKAVREPPSVRAAKRARLVERECQRCGADYADPPEEARGDQRCRYPTVGGRLCGGPLVEVDADDRAAEVHVVRCSRCRGEMRVRGRPYPLEGAPARIVELYERYHATVRCADCEAAAGEVAFSLDGGT
jgi:hypothetical protein